MKLWENWRVLGIIAAISCTIVGIIFLIEHFQTKGNPFLQRKERVISTDNCVRKYGGIELNYENGATTSYTVDLCSVIDCGTDKVSWTGLDVYICMDQGVHRHCMTGKPFLEGWCKSWSQVVGYTGDWSLTSQELRGKVTIQRDYSAGQNPITLSIGPWEEPSWNEGRRLYLVLGVDVVGTDPKAIIRINFNKRAPIPTDNPNDTTDNITAVEYKPPKDVVVTVDYTKLSPEDVIERATGYGESNLWLDWLIATAREQGMGNCIGCAKARPGLFTEPAPLHPKDIWGYQCMLDLTKMATPPNCTILASIFPPINNSSRTGPFTPREENYTCFKIIRPNAYIDLGQINSNWCNVTVTDNGDILGSWERAGLYYYCGGRRLLIRVPKESKGTCAMVRLGAPLVLIAESKRLKRETGIAELTKRRRHHVLSKIDSSSFDITTNSPTYIDGIEIPRGVPNEHKLTNQIASGFENIPIIAALFPITPNKNADRINYVHYNVMKLANLTRDAVEGLAEQLAPTSLMAKKNCTQNRIALDMILAEKGGVCSMFGDSCCTFIPNNTGPDGSVTRALEGLRVLSENMKTHSGINNPLEQWMNKIFGCWKSVIMSLILSMATFLGILVTCGCCCIPCIRSLCNRLIITAVEEKQPPHYQMMVLGLHSENDDDERK